jgi:diguanylate cyclase (GGDEF)-like protein
MQRLLDVFRRRIREDFRFGVFLAFAGAALLLLFPLAFVRFTQGNPVNGVLNLAVSAVIVGAIAYSARGGDLTRLGHIVAVLITLGAMVAIAVGGTGVFWAFPTVLATSFLAPPRTAILLAGALMATLLIEQDSLRTSGQPLAVVLSLTGNAVFGLLFAHRNAQRRVELEQLATRDALTGAENRRSLDTELDIAVAAFRRDGRPVALALFDLDHFKKINDRFGHDVGDGALRDFAQLVQASVRRTDRLFRYGGEEFVLLMPSTDELGLELAMSHLRTQIRQGLAVNGEPLTVSIGGAILRVGETGTSWIGRADEALYRAKSGGRNRLEIDGVS